MRRMVSAVPKPAASAIGLHAVVGVLEQAAGGLDADALDVASGGDTDLGGEAAREVPLAHQRDPGEGGDAAVALRVLGDQMLRHADAVALSRLRLERRAEL